MYLLTLQCERSGIAAASDAVAMGVWAPARMSSV
jgi:hypothetical protein